MFLVRKRFELIELVSSSSTCWSGVFLLSIAGFDELVYNSSMIGIRVYLPSQCLSSQG